MRSQTLSPEVALRSDPCAEWIFQPKGGNFRRQIPGELSEVHASYHSKIDLNGKQRSVEQNTPRLTTEIHSCIKHKTDQRLFLAEILARTPSDLSLSQQRSERIVTTKASSSLALLMRWATSWRSMARTRRCQHFDFKITMDSRCTWGTPSPKCGFSEKHLPFTSPRLFLLEAKASSRSCHFGLGGADFHWK